MAHDHGPAGPGRPLAFALVLTLAFAALEVVLGTVSGSLALISDAGHMLIDSAGLVLALVATVLARRPSDLRRTYGYARVEVLVVPLHVLLMTGLAGYIVYEAISRAGDPPDVAAVPVLAAGVAGLAINVLVLRLLHGHGHENLNVRGAVFEVMADALGSVGVIVSAVVILTTGWTAVDLIISLGIAALLVPRAAMLLWHAVGILLEGTPRGFPTARLEREAAAIPGVRALHDLHVWALAPSFLAVSAHVEVDRMEESGPVIASLTELMAREYGVRHVTLQPETRALHEEIACCISPDGALMAREHEHDQERAPTA